MKVKETYTPKPMSASGRLVGQGCSTGGFLCSTSGTLSITDGEVSGGTTILPSTAVTAGQWLPLPFYFANGAYAVLTSAAGTFGV